MTPLSRLASAAALAIGLGASAQAQVSDDVVRIGIMADQTGPYAGNGGPGLTVAARMAVEDFGGKVLGKPVEVVVADDQNKPDVGLNIARKWLDVDKVDTIISNSASSIALGVSTLMRERGKPYLISGTTTADLTNKACSPMTVQFLTDTYAMAKASVQALMKQGIKTFYFITVDYAFGQAWQQDGTRFIEAAGGKVVGSVKHPLGTTDFSSYLMQAQASGAQAVVFLSAGQDASNALKQAAEYKLARNGQAMGVFGMTINVVAAMGQDVAQGLQFTAPFYWDQDEATRAWTKRFRERYKEGPPTYLMAGAYSATMHYLNAVKAAGTDEGKAVAAKMHELPVNDFFSKDVKVREDGQVMRKVLAVKVKSPSESRHPYDFYSIVGEIPPDQGWRTAADSTCDLLKSK